MHRRRRATDPRETARRRSVLCYGLAVPLLLAIAGIRPLSTMLAFGDTGDPPVENNFSFLRTVTIDHTKVGASTSYNFPLLVRGTYPFLATVANGGEVQSSSGYDIAFASDSGCNSLLHWEQESWSATTGAVIYWVRVPTLSSTTDTVIYLCYGNPATATFQGGPTGAAWDLNYAGVWHFPNGATLDALDSTANGNNGTLVGSPPPSAAAGQIDGAAAFNGAGNYIDVGNSPSVGPVGDMTIEAWVHPNTWTSGQIECIFTKEVGINPAPYLYYMGGETGLTPSLYMGDGTDIENSESATSLATNAWSSLAVTVSVSGSDRVVTHYVNAAATFACCGTGGVITPPVSDGPNDAEIGNGNWGGHTCGFPGYLDEVRMSTVARSADWLLAEYNNQSSPGTFYEVGSASTPTDVTLSPGSLTFPDQVVGTSSSAQSATLRNTGSAALTISSITVSSDFALTTTAGSCPYGGGSVASQNTCTIDVTFAPKSTGNLSGTVTITDNNNLTEGSTQTVSLTGTGTAPVAGVAPSSLTFSSQMVGTASSPQLVTLSNTGDAALTIASIAASANFSESDNCDGSLAASGSCTIYVTFAPTSTGALNGTLTVIDNSNGVAGTKQTVTLKGTAIVPVAGVSPPNLTFGSQNVTTTSASQPVTLSNTGSAALTISSIAISANFGQANACGGMVAAGGSCTIYVTFAPTSTGTLKGALTLTDNSKGEAGSAQTVSLSGTGTIPSVTLSTTKVNFNNEPVNITSAASAVTVTNTGTGPLTFTSLAPSGDFAIAASGTTCSTSAPVAASGQCVVNVTFTPSAMGARSGNLTLNDNAGGSPQTVSLNGTGTEAVVSLSAPLAFPPQLVGSTSSPQTVTLTNTGNSSLTFSAVSVSVPFTIAASGTTCSTSSPLAALAACTVAVTFTPTAAGTAPGSLSFSDNAPGSPQTLALSGTGQDFSLAPALGFPTSATVAPGEAAIYTLSVGGEGGLTGQINFTCIGAPSEATCTVVPNPATLGSTPTSVTVSVFTTAASLSAPDFRPLLPPPPASRGLNLLLILALILTIMTWVIGRRYQLGARRWQSSIVPLAAGILLILALAGCGGGGGSGGSGPSTTPNPGTPTGTYTLKLTGTASSGNSTVSHSVTFTLIVS